MEPANRPYVDPGTDPGDTGTENWADTLPAPEAPAPPGPIAAPEGMAIDDGIVDGSPADEFVNDPGAIAARTKDRDGA